MKQKSIITLIVILALAGAISYGIIWYRKRALKSLPTVVEPGATVKTPGTSGTGYQLPKIETYAWWISKLGHAKFPLGMNSRGVEVLKVQEVLNQKSAAKGLPAITADGIWGFNTDTRFKLIFPSFSAVTQYLFITDFDPNKEILK